MQRCPAYLVLYFACACLLFLAPATAQAQVDRHLKGEVDTGRYNQTSSGSSELTAQVARLYGFEYSSQPAKALPAKITQVTLNDSAWSAGIRAGDQILFANAGANSLSLIVQRNGALFQANLMRAGVATQGKQPAPLTSTLTSLDGRTLGLNQQLAVLSARQVALVIDRSSSMASPDCPGGLTRWQWCAEQIRSLTQQADACLSGGLTVMLFSDGVTQFDHVNASSVPGIFTANQPDGNTRTDLAMQSLLNNYLFDPRNKLPLAVAVITDGEPTYPGALEKVIIDATKRMSNPNQISITFLKVGPEVEGDALLSQMDRDLVQYGAKYDIVSHKSFQDLQRVGLIGALVQSITEQPAARNNGTTASAPAPSQPVTLMDPPPPGNPRRPNAAGFGQAQMQNVQRLQQQQQQQQFQQTRRERADIERQLLGN